MRNNLTVTSAMFVLLFVGKIGNIGTLGSLSWLVVFAPFLVDAVWDFVARMGYYDRLLAKVKIWELKNRLENKSKKIKNNI